MQKRVLVAYASKRGSTVEIAQKIGEILQKEGFPVEILPVNQVKNLKEYEAVILGSAVYYGRWRNEAAHFIKAREQELSQKDVWFFSSGPAGKGDPVELLKGWNFPPLLGAIADRIKPRGITVFHGVLDENQLNFFEKWILNKLGSPSGDFRDWNLITGWARNIAAALKM